MIIPVKCFTCGKVIANKYQKYLDKVGELKKDKSQEINYLDTSNIEKNARRKSIGRIRSCGYLL